MLFLKIGNGFLLDFFAQNVLINWNVFLFNKKPKNLAQELLLLASSKREFDDNQTKKRFYEICDSLKELAKCGKITTIITVPTHMKREMLNLFKEHGFNVFLLPSLLINDDSDFQISWDVIND